jgi:hypothetical protein
VNGIARVWRSPFTRLVLYYIGLVVLAALVVLAFPGLVAKLQQFRELSAISVFAGKGKQIEQPTGVATLSEADLAVITAVAMIAALLLVLPVAWVYLVTKRQRGYDRSVVQTVTVLPMAAAGTIILVQNSLALAFALAAIVAVVRFRNTLRDTQDAVYIFIALGVGIAAGVCALTVGALMSAIFNFTVLGLWQVNFGNLYADQSPLTGRLRLGEALVGPGKSDGGYLALGHPDLLEALAPDTLQEVAARAARLRRYVQADAAATKKKKRYTDLVLVHAVVLQPAQRLVEEVLAAMADRWELAEIQPGEGGRATLEYLVRLGGEIPPTALLQRVKEEGAEQVVAVEYHSLRGLGNGKRGKKTWAA